MEALKPGTTFAAGRYEIVRTIGAGGMGAVYEVLHAETRRKRAMKVMLPSAFADKDLRERFQREAQVTADIESENIVEIFDAGVDASSGSPFLVMELLRGEDLGAMLHRGERLTTSVAVEVFRQVARALDKTHAASIVHRDLKPDNLFLTKREDGSPRVKILDFGIAKLISTTQGKSTKSIGTPLYMAPEQALGVSSEIGPRADLYAFAHVIYTLLVGLPYYAPEAMLVENALALLLEIRKGNKEPATVRAAREGLRLPEPFDAWFDKATALEPAKRFVSAGQMVDELAKILEGSPPARIEPVAAAVTSPKAATAGPEYHATVAARDVATSATPSSPSSAALRTNEITAAQQSGSTVAVSAPAPSGTPAGLGDSAKNTGALEPLSRGTAASQSSGASTKWALLAVPALAVVALVGYLATRSDQEAPAGSNAPTGDATATKSSADATAISSRPEVTAVEPAAGTSLGSTSSSSPSVSATVVVSSSAPSASTKPTSVATIKKTAIPTATAPKATATVWTGGR